MTQATESPVSDKKGVNIHLTLDPSFLARAEPIAREIKIPLSRLVKIFLERNESDFFSWSDRMLQAAKSK